MPAPAHKKNRVYGNPKDPQNIRRKKAKRAKQVAESIRANGGAPSTYDPIFAEQAKALCELGATDPELADFFNVTIVTIWNWSTRHQEFFNALARGKDAADERVKRKMYEKAMGYSYNAEKIQVLSNGEVVRVPYIEHVPPSDGAQKLWLTNRRPEEWKDRRTTEFDPDQPLKIIVEGGLPK